MDIEAQNSPPEQGAGGALDKEKVGAFLAQLRKEKGYTQKELAEKLYVSDKAVSKWERALSMPDIALLTPLAHCLGVSVTELLQGERIPQDCALAPAEVERLVGGALELSEKARRPGLRRAPAYFASALAACLEVALLLAQGWTLPELKDSVLLVVGLCLIFGAWFCFFAREQLPAYYDENHISSFSDGPFRMNLPGVRFHNGNWPFILRAGRLWTLVTPVVYPLLWMVLPASFWSGWGGSALTLTACLGLLAGMMAAAWRHR